MGAWEFLIGGRRGIFGRECVELRYFYRLFLSVGWCEVY